MRHTTPLEKHLPIFLLDGRWTGLQTLRTARRGAFEEFGGHESYILEDSSDIQPIKYELTIKTQPPT